MKLYCWRGRQTIRNFGDDLNPWIWGKLIPDLLDDDDHAIFVGIGTLLNEYLPRARKTAVLGAGVGYGKQLPQIDHTWKIYSLRGPLSARALGVSQTLAITDSAVLVRRLFVERKRKLHRFAYMPHWTNANPTWKLVCGQLRFAYVDPQWPVEKVLSAINQTEVLISEAMHGAIVADSVRVPWIAVNTRPSEVLPFKWTDWCMSMGLDYKPERLTRLWNLHQRSRNHPSVRRLVKSVLGRVHVMAVAAELVRITRRRVPQLSSDNVVERVTIQTEESISRFRKDVAAGYFKAS